MTIATKYNSPTRKTKKNTKKTITANDTHKSLDRRQKIKHTHNIKVYLHANYNT